MAAIGSEVMASLRDMFKRYWGMKEMEIELKLGHVNHHGRFQTGVKKDEYDRVMAFLSKGKGFQRHEETTNDFIFSDRTRITQRAPKGDGQVGALEGMRKERLADIDVHTGGKLDLRVSVSSEIAIDPAKWRQKVGEQVATNATSRRTKMRTSFSYKFWQYDLTEVTLHEGGGGRADYHSFEVELECTDLLALKRAAEERRKHDPFGYAAESLLLKANDLIRAKMDCFDLLHQKYLHVDPAHVYMEEKKREWRDVLVAKRRREEGERKVESGSGEGEKKRAQSKEGEEGEEQAKKRQK
uniref:mRNA 5'-phosphatase n=1 Tax=Palpitomonas bilix TaxID=652834 RepID=A0A7S3DG96_9EUKA|mmetsp:Transcript_35639/g.92899  ORF Transcript_35639/g.92899 Transcript_35639/m.92899 type:complete len:298 (+) Transcript_35639:212-1105(+)